MIMEMAELKRMKDDGLNFDVECIDDHLVVRVIGIAPE
jgi:hypothetical protein